CPTQRSRRVSTALPYRSANHPYFAEFLGALGVNRTPDPPFRRQPLSSAELRGQVARHKTKRDERNRGGANATLSPCTGRTRLAPPSRRRTAAACGEP